MLIFKFPLSKHNLSHFCIFGESMTVKSTSTKVNMVTSIQMVKCKNLMYQWNKYGEKQLLSSHVETSILDPVLFYGSGSDLRKNLDPGFPNPGKGGGIKKLIHVKEKTKKAQTIFPSIKIILSFFFNFKEPVSVTWCEHVSTKGDKNALKL